MTTRQPEALRLAEQYDYGDPAAHSNTWKVAVCTELRRLHAYCQELESQVILDCMTHVQNPAEIEHVAGDVSKNGAGLNMSSQHARIADLEAQLEAIGAGGVSGPLIGQPQAVPDLSQLTERGAKAWAGVDAQGLREGFTAADMATVSAQGFRDGVASLTAQAADSQPAQVMGDTPPPCDQELFDQGVSVGLFDIPKWTAEALCRGIAAATEARVDWHYIGGRVHIKALPAARAPADIVQAGEYTPLVCDYCGALTPDPWHSSGMLHGKMSKHIHSCDACAARGAAKAQAAKQQEQLI